jgi:hypothetical protein
MAEVDMFKNSIFCFQLMSYLHGVKVETSQMSEHEYNYLLNKIHIKNIE